MNPAVSVNANWKLDPKRQLETALVRAWKRPESGRCPRENLGTKPRAIRRIIHYPRYCKQVYGLELGMGGRKKLVGQLIRFFVTALIGLGVDLGVFWILTCVGVLAGFANGVSSLCAVVALYLVSSRYAFGVGGRLLTVLLFLAWYAISIVCFSLVIQFAVSIWDWEPLWAKLTSLPFSFVANFIAIRLVFSATGISKTVALKN